MDLGPNTRLSHYIVYDYQDSPPGDNPFRMETDWPDPIVLHQEERPLHMKTVMTQTQTQQLIMGQEVKKWFSKVYGLATDWCTQGWQQFWFFYQHLQVQSARQNQLTYNKCWECGQSLENITGELSHSWRQKYCPPCWQLYRQDLVNEICSQIFTQSDESPELHKHN